VRGKLVVICVLVALPALLTAGAAAAKRQPHARHPAHAKRPAHKKHAPGPEAHGLVNLWPITYRAHDGKPRRAFVSLPLWYGPKNNPPLPLVISPHGRGVTAHANARLWGNLPEEGGFAVISPDGAGRKLDNYSWGSLGQIEDLSRMPQIARLTLPWLKLDTRRIYAVGGSMGGQETLLLLARYPRLLAGAAAFDSVTDLARQYRSFPRIPCKHGCRSWDGNLGRELQSLAREEIGGTPKTRPLAYAVRSPITYARSIAASCVPLQLWWSLSDRIVVDQQQQSGALFRKIRELNPRDPVAAYVGYWAHSAEMKASNRLPLALVRLGLLTSDQTKQSRGLRFSPPPNPADCRR
jgi:pimeloyl-ACP methyl ester carboxylesterase